MKEYGIFLFNTKMSISVCGAEFRDLTLLESVSLMWSFHLLVLEEVWIIFGFVLNVPTSQFSSFFIKCSVLGVFPQISRFWVFYLNCVLFGLFLLTFLPFLPMYAYCAQLTLDRKIDVCIICQAYIGDFVKRSNK
jgi:hypothetical protein